ncbi:pancreatic triacylglycerol lipase [Vespula maculifrons]|uniref:phospholipase A1 n=1 Tax=Vespula maculifrons TaxID=7453 RepID=A0ABD2AYQ6_VESMC
MSLVESYILLATAFVSAYAHPQNTLLNDVETIIKSVFKAAREPATFNLYTRENPFGEEQLFLNNTEVLYASHFNESRPTKFIVHGFSDTGNEAWVRGLIDEYHNVEEKLEKFHDNHGQIVSVNTESDVARFKGQQDNTLIDPYLLHEDVNVIVVGWGILAADVYPVAANNTRKVGEFFGDFLEFLNRESNLEYKDVHISGHSLGSHVAGFAGAYLDGRIGRITGLDPASPLFETISGIVDPEFRLDPTDAQFVDVIHTSGPAFGFLAPLGHADFYPNNGEFPQPGCSFLPTTTYCSHSRAHQFMTESIGSTAGFKARTCESWEKYKERRCDYNPIVLMGEYASTSRYARMHVPQFSSRSPKRIFLDLRCEHQNVSKLISKASKYHMYDEAHKWLIIGHNLKESLKIIDDSNFNIATDVIIAEPSTHGYVLYDVYNLSKDHGGSLKTILFGTWHKETGLYVTLIKHKFNRRANLQGMKLNVGVHFDHKLSNMSIDKYLLDYNNKSKDSHSKFMYAILINIAELYNFT